MKKYLLFLIPLVLLSSCVKESPEPLYVPELADPENRKSVRTTEWEGIGYELFDDGTCEIISADESAYNGSSLSLPDVFDDCEVIAIRDGVFEGGSFTHVVWPRSLRSIGARAFRRSQLTELNLPDSVTEIGEEAFSSCVRLEKVTLSASMKTVPLGAFYGCRSLKEVVMKEGIEEIGEEAFGDLPLLKTVNLPDSLKVIGAYAFWHCGTDELSFRLPEGLERVEKSAFDDTPWLESQREEWVLCGSGVLLRYNGTDTAVTLPENVRFLSNAFDQSPVLDLTVPDSLEGIAKDALTDSRIGVFRYGGNNEEIKKELGL